MKKSVKNVVSLETLKKELRPFIRQEIKRVISDLLKKADRKYPSESRIRRSFIKQMEEIEKSIEPKIYTKQDILEL